MHLGFGRLRLASAEFWAMTPREIASCLAPQKQRPEVNLQQLMQLYPDDPATKDRTHDQ